MSRFENFSFTDNRDLLRNIQLEASAGTGKTYSIERIVSLLIATESLSLSQILIVTFTKKAARELKERIRLILLDASRKGTLDLGGETYELDEREQENIHQSVLEFEKASIFTIHSFCLNMLKAYPFESLSQFSMDMESREDITGEAVRDYMREIGESMKRGQLIKYKAFLEGAGFEDAVSRLSEAVDRELLGPHIGIIPDRDLSNEILESVMAFNNERGDLYESWKKMINALPEQDHLEDLGFGYVKNRIMPGINKLKLISSEGDFISICSALSSGKVLNSLVRFLPENLMVNLKKTADSAAAEADSFVRAVEDFLNLYMFDENNVEANLYNRALKAAFLSEAYEEIRKKLHRKKDITGKLDFNDLIGKLHQGLCGGGEAFRPELVSEIRRRYRTVLIDEFQDTDSRQWDIFNVLFGRDDRHNFFLVGDPKQSIYRFRGADLEIYHKACSSDEVNGRYTLGRNFRSVSSLVSAVNRLFAFIFSPEMHCGETVQTPFIPVEAGRPNEPLINDGKAAFEFIRLETPAEEENELAGLKDSRDLYYRLIAYKSYKLLQEDRKIGDKPVRPGDIAILTESNKDCQTLQSLLSGYSIPSVINARVAIFDTEEAGEFLLFLQALVRMDNSSVKQLLLSRFFGHTPVEVEAMESSGEIDLFSGKLLHWREMVDRGKVIEVSRELFDYSRLEERILAERNGERSYTNYRQILEFLHREQLLARLDSEALFSLLLEKIRGSSGMDEDLIRLDKDSEAVQIMTMHASKGLEFPIVFFAGALKNDVSSGFQDFYDFVKDSERYYDFLKLKKNKSLQSMDLWEEKKRLYYVALTRASSRLYLPSIKNLEASYLSSLYSSFCYEEIERMVTDHKNVISCTPPIHSGLSLKGSSQDKKALQHSIAEAVDSSVIKQAEEHSELFSIDRDLEGEYLSLKNRDSLLYRGEGDAADLSCPEVVTIEGFEDRYSKVSSYSSIIRDAEHEHPGKESHNDADRDDLAPIVREEKTEETLTRGAVLGELVHLLFETLDYSLVREMDFSAFSSNDDVENLFRDLSVRFFNGRWYGQFARPLKSLIYNTLKNEIDGSFALCDIEAREKLHEMEFHMSVNDCEELPVGPDFTGKVEEGYLKGFIDLIFRHDGKYYIADWKTTSSPVGDSYDSYRKEILEEMMISHHYKLQSMIYMIALYRYLTVTEGDRFDYDRDFGGCYYFFVRGMSGEKGSDKGVYFHRPPLGELLDFAARFTPLEVEA